MMPISQTWRSAVEQFIEENGILKEADHFAGKIFRKQFFPIIGGVYFDELLTQTQLDIVNIVEWLQLNPGTLTRWNDESFPPAADKFFAVVLLILRRDLQTITFPKRNVLLFRSIKRQVERFANDFCETPKCVLNQTVFRAMMHAMHHPSSDKLAPGVSIGQKEREKLLMTSTIHVNQQLKRDFDDFRFEHNTASPKAPTVDPVRLAMWYSSWGIPYTMFAMGTGNAEWGISDA